MAIALRYAARSDVGLVRSNNQDSGYAGPHLLVIADGMGGHAGGDVASSLAIGELAALDGESHGSDDALEHLSAAVRAAHRELLTRVGEEPELSGMGTTVTALLRAGGRLALAHIGDSRGYVLRDGALVQITHDHTFVQTLVDEGRITIEEAEQHPQRSVLMRVLSDVVEDVEPDLSMREARVGDRYLLCSDGLSGVVSFDTLQETLATGKPPEDTCEALVQLALRSGAPDNVTCIVADVVDAGDTPPDTVPSVVGAATSRQAVRPSSGTPSPAERAAELTAPAPAPAAEPAAPEPGSRVRRFRRYTAAGLALGLLVGAGAYGAWRWSQVQFFVGSAQGQVAIYRGLPQNLGPIRLSSVDQLVADVPVDELPSYSRQRVQRGIIADDKNSAGQIVQQLRDQVQACRAAQDPALATGTASPSPTTALPGSTATGPAGGTGTAPAVTPGVTPGVTAPTGTPVLPTTTGAVVPTRTVPGTPPASAPAASTPAAPVTPPAVTGTATPTTATPTGVTPTDASVTPTTTPPGTGAVDCEGLG